MLGDARTRVVSLHLTKMNMLPPELWRVIFRKSTEIPAPMINVQSLIDRWSWSYSHFQDEHRFATKTTLNLMLVCKEWHSIAIEFLYEDVRPQSIARLESLCTVLEEKKREPDDTEGIRARARTQDLGWWTKAFYSPHHLSDGDKTDGLIDLFVRLTARFPNLVLCHIAEYITSSRDHERLAQTLRESCHNLQYLHCNHWKSRTREAANPVYLSIPTLQDFSTVLAGSQPSLPSPIRHQQLMVLALSLDGGSDLSGMDTILLPCLRCISLEGQGFGPGFMQFFDIHGPQIISLASDHDANVLLKGHDTLLKRCTALEELFLTELISGSELADPEITLTYPSVIRLGIRISQSVHGHRAPMLKFDCFPNLRVVTFVDIRFNALDDEQRSLFKRSLPETRSVVYEDEVGQSIPFPTS